MGLCGWVLPIDVDNCVVCSKGFGFLTHKKHCYACGNVVCSSCSDQKAIVESIESIGPQRVCTLCHWGQEVVTPHHYLTEEESHTLDEDEFHIIVTPMDDDEDEEDRDDDNDDDDKNQINFEEWLEQRRIDGITRMSSGDMLVHEEHTHIDLHILIGENLYSPTNNHVDFIVISEDEVKQKLEFELDLRPARVLEIDANGNSLISLACKKGMKEIVELLVERGADIDAINAIGHTPLMIAGE